MKITEKVELTKKAAGKLQPFLVDITITVMMQEFIFSNHQTKY